MAATAEKKFLEAVQWLEVQKHVFCGRTWNGMPWMLNAQDAIHLQTAPY